MDRKKLPEFANEGEARAAMRDGFASQRPHVIVLGFPHVAETIDTLLAIIDAPGPLDHDALAPALETFSRQIAEVFSQGAEEFSGSLREEMVSSAAGAKEDVAFYEGERRRRSPRVN